MFELIIAKIGYEGLAFLALFALTEILPFTPLKSNGIVQFLIQFANGLKPLRKEDDKIQQIKDALK